MPKRISRRRLQLYRSASSISNPERVFGKEMIEEMKHFINMQYILYTMGNIGMPLG